VVKPVGKVVTLFAYDGAAFRPVVLDATGKLQIEVTGSALADDAASETTLASLLAQINSPLLGFNLPICYQRIVRVATGAVEQLGTTYGAAGYAYVFTCISAYNEDNVCTFIDIGLYTGVTFRSMQTFVAPVATQAVCWTGHMYMPDDHQPMVRFRGCTIGDNLYVTVHGFRSKIE